MEAYYGDHWEADDVIGVKLMFEDILRTRRRVLFKDLERLLIEKVSAWSGDSEDDNAHLRQCARFLAPKMWQQRKHIRTHPHVPTEDTDLMQVMKSQGLINSV